MLLKSDKGHLKQISSGSTYHNNFWVIFVGVAFPGGEGVGYSEFQVTGMIDGFFRFEMFNFGISLGYNILASIFWGSLI